MNLKITEFQFKKIRHDKTGGFLLLLLIIKHLHDYRTMSTHTHTHTHTHQLASNWLFKQIAAVNATVGTVITMSATYFHGKFNVLHFNIFSIFTRLVLFRVIDIVEAILKPIWITSIPTAEVTVQLHWWRRDQTSVDTAGTQSSFRELMNLTRIQFQSTLEVMPVGLSVPANTWHKLRQLSLDARRCVELNGIVNSDDAACYGKQLT